MEQKRTAGTFFANVGKALCYLLLFLLCQVLISAVYSVAASVYFMLNPGSGIDPTELIFSCSDQISLFSGVAAIVLLLAFFLLCRKNPLRETGFVATRGRYVFTAIALTPILYAAVTVVLGFLPEEWLADYAEASAALNQTGLLMTIATVLVAPVVEEVVFRGLVLSRLRRAMPGWLAVLISALVFGLCHGQIVWMAYAFVLGVIFGFMALRARSIWPSLCAHILFNGIGQIAVYLPETELAGMLFLGGLAVVGCVLCIAVFVFRTFHPLTDRDAT